MIEPPKPHITKVADGWAVMSNRGASSYVWVDSLWGARLYAAEAWKIWYQGIARHRTQKILETRHPSNSKNP